MCVPRPLFYNFGTCPPRVFSVQAGVYMSKTNSFYFLQSSVAPWLTLADCSWVSHGSDSTVRMTGVLFWVDDAQVQGWSLLWRWLCKRIKISESSSGSKLQGAGLKGILSGQQKLISYSTDLIAVPHTDYTYHCWVLPMTLSFSSHSPVLSVAVVSPRNLPGFVAALPLWASHGTRLTGPWC